MKFKSFVRTPLAGFLLAFLIVASMGARSAYQGFLGGMFLTVKPTLSNGQASGFMMNASGAVT